MARLMYPGTLCSLLVLCTGSSTLGVFAPIDTLYAIRILYSILYTYCILCRVYCILCTGVSLYCILYFIFYLCIFVDFVLVVSTLILPTCCIYVVCIWYLLLPYDLLCTMYYILYTV